VWDDFSDDWTFEYPRGWVARRNSLRKGVVISDFQARALFGGACSVSVERAARALFDRGLSGFRRGRVL
jgi:hypothetical protein